MIQICLNDQKKFEAKRSTARFCSATCRKDYARKTGEENPFLTSAEEEDEGDYDHEAALKAFNKMGLDNVKWLSTGIKSLDELTMIPRGRITQIQGPYGVGKTTLCLNMVGGMADTKVLYIDTEASLNPAVLDNLKVNYKKFTLYNKTAYIEDISTVIQDAAKSGDYDVIVLDSVAATTTRTESEGKITDRNIGQKAFFMGKLVRMVQMDLKNNDTALVIINQERDVIGSYVPQKYTPGGTAVPYAASLIIALKTIKSWRFPKSPSDGIYLGHEVEATIIKSKVNTPWRKTSFKLHYPDPQATDEF